MNIDNHECEKEDSGIVCCGLCCIYNSLDFSDFLMGYKSKSQCLCITREVCCAVDEVPVGVGLVTNPDNNEICKIGLYCCAVGCKVPDRICTQASQLWCVKQVGALPFHEDYLTTPVCFQLGCGKHYYEYHEDCFTNPKCEYFFEMAPPCRALSKPMSHYDIVPTHEPMGRY